MYRVTIDDLQQETREKIVIDIRAKADYEKETYPGAIHLFWEEFDAHMDEILGKHKNKSEYDLAKEDDSESMSKKIKIKLSDIDSSSINTSAFSQKLDAFLDQKSDQLIKDYSCE